MYEREYEGKGKGEVGKLMYDGFGYIVPQVVIDGLLCNAHDSVC